MRKFHEQAIISVSDLSYSIYVLHHLDSRIIACLFDIRNNVPIVSWWNIRVTKIFISMEEVCHLFGSYFLKIDNLSDFLSRSGHIEASCVEFDDVVCIQGHRENHWKSHEKLCKRSHETFVSFYSPHSFLEFLFSLHLITLLFWIFTFSFHQFSECIMSRYFESCIVYTKRCNLGFFVW